MMIFSLYLIFNEKYTFFMVNFMFLGVEFVSKYCQDNGNDAYFFYNVFFIFVVYRLQFFVYIVFYISQLLFYEIISGT